MFDVENLACVHLHLGHAMARVVLPRPVGRPSAQEIERRRDEEAVVPQQLLGAEISTSDGDGETMSDDL